MTASHRVLLVIGGKAPHEYPRATEILCGLMKDAGMQATASSDPASLSHLSGYDCVVLYTDGEMLDDGGIESLAGFVRNGGGLVGIHSVAGTNKQSEMLGKLIGSRIISGSYTKFAISVSDAGHPLAQGVQGFEVDDELYTLDPKGDYHVFLTAPADGKPQPMGYSRTEGRGRVVYLATGHNLATLRHPTWSRIFTCSVDYAAGR